MYWYDEESLWVELSHQRDHREFLIDHLWQSLILTDVDECYSAAILVNGFFTYGVRFNRMSELYTDRWEEMLMLYVAPDFPVPGIDWTLEVEAHPIEWMERRILTFFIDVPLDRDGHV